MVTLSPIDPDQPGYVWHQIVRQILEQVAAGHAAPGSRLPSIPDMSHTFEVAQTTVQRALGWLVEHKVVTAYPGKGTYIASRLPSRLPTPPDGSPLP